MPVNALNNAAASATVRAMGPAVSCVEEMGMMPERLRSPTVGFKPTMPHDDAGETMDPSVSEPMATVHKSAATAAPEPELEPEALRSSMCGLRVSPPRPLQPEMERSPRKLAHSLRLVLPRTTAPAARSRVTMNASLGAEEPAKANEPAVVCMRSPVSMLSLMSTGTPWRGLRGPFVRRSSSSARAMATASGFNSMTELRRGPLRSSR